MVTQRRSRSAVKGFIDELQALVRARFPDAEFEVEKVEPKEEYYIHVYGDFEDTYDVLDLTSDRATDILVDHDIFIHVLPLGRRISS